MTKQLIINTTFCENRVACLDGGVLQRFYIELVGADNIIGNIYKGTVSKVIPGIQSAFLDIGLERSVFLHISDMIPRNTDNYSNNATKCITSMLTQDKEVLVQVLKSPIGTKGAKVTTNITIPSRYLILVPSTSTVTVSHQITSEQERQRLKTIVEEFNCAQYGVIIRTVATGVSAEELLEDYTNLVDKWQKIKFKTLNSKAPSLVYKEALLIDKIFRDLRDIIFDEIIIDNKNTYTDIKNFCTKYLPNIVPKLHLYEKKIPIFETYNIENQLTAALQPRIDLPSGGYIIIEQTEAMTTIDVNTGSYIGSSNMEDTIFNTNIEASNLIASQIQLRNLGGIIIIDYIDMHEEQHREAVLAHLNNCFLDDHGKTTILGFTKLGLVELTRKRTRKSLEHLTSHKCSKCQGTGSVKTVETICYELIREILRISSYDNMDMLEVNMSESMAKYFTFENAQLLQLIKNNIPVNFKFNTDSTMCYDKYSIQCYTKQSTCNS